MFARIQVDLGTRPDSILVPERAVAELQGKNFVWVIGPDNKATQRPVKVGEQIGESLLILEGLKAGERIVVEGLQKVREGAPVQAHDRRADGRGRSSGRRPPSPPRKASQARQGVTVMADFFIRRPIVAMVIAILTVIVGADLALNGCPSRSIRRSARR